MWWIAKVKTPEQVEDDIYDLVTDELGLHKVGAADAFIDPASATDIAINILLRLDEAGYIISRRG